MAIKDKTVGGSENSAITAKTTTVALNDSTSTKIVDALTSDEQNHIKIFVLIKIVDLKEILRL